MSAVRALTEKRREGVGVQIVDVDPATARLWLERNPKNRDLRAKEASKYAFDMRNGDWQFTGEPIIFDDDGNLIDGQHRLLGLIEAEVTLPFLVVRGVSDTAQDDIDSGIPRKFADVLKIAGEPNSNALAAITRKVYEWDQGVRMSTGKVKGNFATNRQLGRCLERYPELRDIARDAKRVAGGCGLPTSAVGLLMYAFSRIDHEDSTFFFDRLADGQGLTEGDPIYRLREKITSERNVRGTTPYRFLVAITIKAWNAYREGTPVHRLQWRMGGANPEPFPEPR
jgi:hypothetical protein